MRFVVFVKYYKVTCYVESEQRFCSILSKQIVTIQVTVEKRQYMQKLSTKSY